MIQRELDKSEKLMGEIQQTTNLYLPSAQIFSGLFFTIKNLEQLDKTYQFSLEFYNKVLEDVLERNTRLQKERGQEQRI